MFDFIQNQDPQEQVSLTRKEMQEIADEITQYYTFRINKLRNKIKLIKGKKYERRTASNKETC